MHVFLKFIIAKAEKDRERYMNAKVEFQQTLKDEKNGLISEKVEKPIEDSEEEEPEEDMDDEREESE